jgi:hypothetical protein
VGQNAKLLAEEFERGKFHLHIAKDFATVMSKLHSKTYNQNIYPIRNRRLNMIQIEEIIKRFRLKGAYECLPMEADQLFNSSLQNKSSLIYAD